MIQHSAAVQDLYPSCDVVNGLWASPVYSYDTGGVGRTIVNNKAFAFKRLS